MHKIFKVLLLGLAAGILAATPLAFQSPHWQAIVAVLLHWLGLSIIIAYARMALSSWASGLLIAGLTSIPLALLTDCYSLGNAAQIIISSLVLGGLLGYTAERLVRNQP